MADSDNNILIPVSPGPEVPNARHAADVLLEAMEEGDFDLDLAAIDRLNALPVGLVPARP